MILNTIMMILFAHTVVTEIQILDYSNANFIQIHSGLTRLKNGYFKLIHVIEINKYVELVNTLNSELMKLPKENTAFPFMLEEISQLKTQIKRMMPRKRRSLDILGTAWKWLAGSPDHEDHRIIEDHIQGLLTNNERQRIINKGIIDRINRVTKVTNSIMKSVNASEEVQKTLEDNLTNKIRILKEEITNIEYALQWAKVGIINSFILSEKEIEEAKIFLESESFLYNNLEEALSFASIKIASNENAIIYIVNLPSIDKFICEKSIIKPIKKNNTIIKMNYENIIQCKNFTFAIKDKCIEINKLCICDKENLIDLSETKCIPNLLTSQKHECTIVNNQHVPSIEELYEGTILLNNFNGTVNVEGHETHSLSGTYIIQFHNETLIIKNKTYTSKENIFVKPLPAILQYSSGNQLGEEILSLELIKELNVDNIEEIKSISTKSKITTSINFSLSIIMIVVILCCCKRYRNSFSVNLPSNEKPTQSPENLPRNRDQKNESLEIPLY